MDWRTRLAGTAGVSLTLLGVAVLVVPETTTRLPGVEQLIEIVGTRDPAAVALVLTLVVTLSVAVTARNSDPRDQTPAERRFEQLCSRPPEAVSADRQAVAGEGYDQAVTRAVTLGGESLDDLRETLQALAVDVCVETEGWTTAEARRAVRGGTWTRDPLAAAFLSGSDGPSTSVVASLRLWVAPARERRRRVDRTLSAIERRYR
ncbi:DUF7269 family protein [Halovenus marina]|uniref:DUF7269 family protein n=1 Tax=Halovenus marina TaxID=3396621 RepID=UPI003F5437E9